MKKICAVWMALACWIAAGAQNRYEVVIDEIMADPAPVVGLPNNEWIEIRNTGNVPVNLQNWRLGDASSLSGAFPAYVLQPDSVLIICTSGAVAGLSVFGKTISVTSFPSLDNAGDLLYLKSASGKIMDAVQYSDSWHSNALKKEGGWSLEMIDVQKPCGGSSNWTSSVHPAGGTPGNKNSVDAVNLHVSGPVPLNVFTNPPNTITVVFDHPADSTMASRLSNYTISDGIACVQAHCIPPLFNSVQLRTSGNLQAGKVYTLHITGIADCSLQPVNNAFDMRTGVPENPLSGEWVINELLFNPAPGGSDYAELLNTSEKIFDASVLFIANRNSAGVLSTPVPLSANPFYIFPGEYVVVTEDPDWLARNYFVPKPDRVLKISSLPSCPDDAGDLVILDAGGMVLDELKYSADWHFKLISNAEGVALERADPKAPNEAGNWHSAASTAGFGTPTAKNSQAFSGAAGEDVISLSPPTFSPDNDGRDDYLQIRYQLPSTGYLANITVFDMRGRMVRLLVRAALLGANGYWIWDGLDEQGRALPPGPYIIFSELFNLEGKKIYGKKVVVKN